MDTLISLVKKINSKVRLNNGLVFTFLKFAIAAGLIIYLIYSVNIHEIIFAFQRADYRFITVALVLSVANVLLQFYKWKLSCAAILNEYNNKKILYSLFYGFAAGPFTPVRVGEYLGRALEFKDKSLLSVTTATLIDKAFTFVPITLFGSIGSILFLKDQYNVNSYLSVSLFVIILVLFSVLVILILNPNMWQNLLSKQKENTKHLGKIYSQIILLRQLSKKFLTQMFFVSVLFYLFFIVQYAVLALAFSQSGNFINFLWAGNMVMFAKTIIPQVSFADLGVREGASVFFLSKMGQPNSVGFDASISLFGINVLLPAIIGLVLLIKKNNA